MAKKKLNQSPESERPLAVVQSTIGYFEPATLKRLRPEVHIFLDGSGIGTVLDTLDASKGESRKVVPVAVKFWDRVDPSVLKPLPVVPGH